MNKILFFLSVLIVPFMLLAVSKDEAVIQEYMISPNIEDFDCHSSSIVEVSPGILCAAWKGGAGKGLSNIDMKQNVGIWFSIFENGKWNEPKQLVKSLDSVCWSPVLAKHPNGKLMLFYRIGADPRRTISLFKTSEDGGNNWSEEEILPAGIVGPTKTKPLIDREGNLICGSSVEVGEPDDELKATACWVEILSKDQKWSKHGPIEIPGKRFGCIEPTLFWADNGTLRLLCRDRSNRVDSQGWIWMAESKDGGRTWSEMRKTELPNPDSGVDVVSLGENNLLLVYNHSHTNRFPLSVALSKDGGETWNRLFDLEEVSGEFPSAALDSEGNVHVSYAWSPPGKSQRQIKHVVISAGALFS